MAVMDSMTAVGVVRVIKRDKESGEILFDRMYKNQVTNYARKQMAIMWIGHFHDTPTRIAVGTGSPPSGETGTKPSDTVLWAELANTRKVVDYAETWLDYYVQYSVTYQQTEAIGTVTGDNPTATITLTEAGLFDVAGNLWSHVKLTDVTHDNTSTLSIQWQILMQGN